MPALMQNFRWIVAKRFKNSNVGYLLAACYLWVCVPCFGQTDDSLSIQEQCEQICQDTSAPWRSIPWQTDLLNAQKMAAESEKPIFVWAMDGHPLGCT